MHPETEEYLYRLRLRLDSERSEYARALSPTPRNYGQRAWLAQDLTAGHVARGLRFFLSLRDWPQPGRPA